MKQIIRLSILLLSFQIHAQWSHEVAVLKYRGGGDYYANPTSLPNLVRFCNEQLGTKINPEVSYVDIGSQDIFKYPFIHMTGHGNVVFSNSEAENLRTYLESGGFLHIDDNYGMDEFIRPELKKLFPNQDLVELPSDHPIYQQKFTFRTLPKIHEHDGKRAQAFGIIEKGRLVLLYTYETDLGDGWENPEVHHDPADKRQEALRMGANIMMYVMMQ